VLARRATILVLALAALAAAMIALPAVGGATGDAKRATKTTHVEDDFFDPDELKIHKGDKVKWVWSDTNTQTHNVLLGSTHPKGVKSRDFRSGSASTAYRFKRKFKVAGKYGFICTYHRKVMKQTVTVKKH
jgi:plastocyanin